MKRTSRQRRDDYRRQFWAQYPEWLARRRLEDGCVGHMTRYLLVEHGHARAMYRAEMDYVRLARKWKRRRLRRL